MSIDVTLTLPEGQPVADAARLLWEYSYFVTDDRERRFVKSAAEFMRRVSTGDEPRTQTRPEVIWVRLVNTCLRAKCCSLAAWLSAELGKVTA